MGWSLARYAIGPLLMIPFLAIPVLGQDVSYSDEKCLASSTCKLLMNGTPDYGRIEAEVLEVIDADSLRLKLHLLPGLEYTVNVRSRGVDAPEKRGTDCVALGAAARTSIAGKFEIGRWVYLENVEYDKYGGRLLADIFRRDSDRTKTLTQELIETGMGVAYDGNSPRQDWCITIPEAANDNG